MNQLFSRRFSLSNRKKNPFLINLKMIDMIGIRDL